MPAGMLTSRMSRVILQFNGSREQARNVSKSGNKMNLFHVDYEI